MKKPIFYTTYHSEIAGEDRPTGHDTFESKEAARAFAEKNMRETTFKVEPVPTKRRK